MLILGGNGFIGRNLGNYMADNGWDVYSFDRELPVSPKAKIHYLEGDFFADDMLEDIVRDKDVIYHAISTINPGNSNTEYMRGYEKDFIQTIKLCEIIQKNGSKLIFLSSGGTVYGKQKLQPIKEDALPRPINHYGNIKLCIENTIRTFAYQDKGDMLIARISNPYGPGQDYTKGVGFIDAAMKKALQGESIEVWGNGEVVRDYLYIDDVCMALAALAESVDIPNGVINISSGTGTSIKEILNIIEELHGKLCVQYREARSVDVQEVVLDNKHMRDIMKKPLYDIRVGIERYYRYLERNI